MAQLVGRRQEAAASSMGKENRSASPSMTGALCRHRCPVGLRSAPAAPSSRPSTGKENRSTSPTMTGVPSRHRGPMGLRPAPAAPSSRPSMGKENRSTSPTMTGVLGRHRGPMGLRPAPAAPSSRSSMGKENRSASPSMTGAPCRHRCPVALRSAPAAPSSRPSMGKENRSASPSMTGAPCRHRCPVGLRSAPAAPSSRPSTGKENRSTSPSMTGAPCRHCGPTVLRSAPAAPSSRPSMGKENRSTSPSMTGAPGRHRDPMGPRSAAASTSCRLVSAVAPRTGVSTFSALDQFMEQLRRLELEKLKIVQLEMLKSQSETPAYIEEIVAFVNTLELAHQYFDFKDFLRAFCGHDKYDFTDSATSSILTALPEQLNMFDKLSLQDIGAAVNAHTLDMRHIIFDNSERSRRSEKDDTYAFANPIFVSALQARKGDSVMHEYPEVELQNVKNSIEYFQDNYFRREPAFKSSKSKSDAKKVKNVTSKLTEAWKKYRQLRCYCEELSEAMNGAKGSGIPATDANDKAAKGLHGENVLDIGQMV